MIYVACYKGKSLMSRAIMWLNWSDYSHAALITSRGTVIEAWGEGFFKGQVREVPFILSQHKPNTGVDIFEPIGIEEWQCAIVETMARSQVGKPYDWRGVFRFLSRSTPSVDGAWFCSELVAAAFAAAKFPLLNRVPQKIFPGLIPASPRLRKVTDLGKLNQYTDGSYLRSLEAKRKKRNSDNP